MTNEQAIKMLKSKMDGHMDTSYEWAETVRMAIKALKQQPREDTISRQAAIDLTWKDPSYSDPLNVLTEVRDGIKALPSAQPYTEEETEEKGTQHDDN